MRAKFGMWCYCSLQFCCGIYRQWICDPPLKNYESTKVPTSSRYPLFTSSRSNAGCSLNMSLVHTPYSIFVRGIALRGNSNCSSFSQISICTLFANSGNVETRFRNCECNSNYCTESSKLWPSARLCNEPTQSINARCWFIQCFACGVDWSSSTFVASIDARRASLLDLYNGRENQ